MAMSKAALAAKREYMRKYRQANKEKINAYHREWRQENSEKVQEYTERYWSKKAQEIVGNE